MKILFCFILFMGLLQANDEIAKTTHFPVRLTPEEEASQNAAAQPCPPPASCDACCPIDPPPCPPPCCKPPSLNCPPIMPRCNPCDCVIDYYNPLIYNSWDLSVEWLFWTVHQKSSTFALSPNGIHQPSPPNNARSDSIGKYHSADFGWNSGVRAALAYTFERDAWNLMGQYTYYGTGDSNTVHRPNDPTLYLEPTNRETILSQIGPSELKSRAHLSYQVLDLLLSRRFLPGCQILFHFFAGPTAAWIHERWKIKAFDTGMIPNVETMIRNTWKFRGGGMRAGLDVSWHMGAGFGLYNQFSFASLVGSYQNRKKTEVAAVGGTDPLIAQLVTPNLCDTSENEIWVVPATQLEFGIHWNHRFCHWAISLQGAFEINTWYDLHQYHQDGFSPSVPNSNKIDYRNASPVSLWGTSWRVNFSF